LFFFSFAKTNIVQSLFQFFFSIFIHFVDYIYLFQSIFVYFSMIVIISYFLYNIINSIEKFLFYLSQILLKFLL